ncbi:hypothetical protein EX30DRAFT_70148 [Ascodesmis nigricans]|uniref:C2H2-type domain-containing protein n=1 Tax=Ascodesmis nigricans TaxID=341454 RepID=A0A4S2MTM7_9PEZI|nr:hypothetical protein EX30DRAFT_70148 [Ascodesmis nigricans]
MTLYRHSRMVAANDVRRYFTQLRDNNNSENSPGKPRPLFYLRREDLNSSREGITNGPENRWSYPHTERQRNYRNTLRLARANRRDSTPGIAIPFSDDNESEDDSDHIARSPGDEPGPFFEDSDSITSAGPNQEEETVVVHAQHNDIKPPTSPNIAFQALQALPEHHFRSLTRPQETNDVDQGSNNQGIVDPANLAAHMDWQKYWESHPVEPGTFWSMEIDEDVGLSEQPVTPPDFPGMGQEEVAAGQNDSEIQEAGMDDEPECCPWPGCDWNEPTRLNTHIRRSHLKGLHCPINGCEARFGEQWQIRNHIKSVHPGMSDNVPGRPQLESEVNFIQERLFSGRNKFTHPTKIAICAAQSPSELESITGLRNRVRLARTAWKARIGPDPPPQPLKPVTPVQQVQQQPTNNTIVTDTRPSGTKQATNDFGASALEAFRMMNLSEPDAHSASIFASVLKRGFVDHQGRMERERAVRTFQLALDYTSNSINSSSAWNSGTGTSANNPSGSSTGGSKGVKYATLGQQNTDQNSLLLNIGYPSSGSNEPFQNSSSPSSSPNQPQPVGHHIYAIPMTDMSTAGFSETCRKSRQHRLS